MLTVSRQNNSCQEGWTICNGRGLIHHLLYPTSLYLFYLKVLFINQFCFYWLGNLSFFIMCHYATPFAALTAVIRPQVYPPTQTLRHGGAHTHITARGRLRLRRVTWASQEGTGEETEVKAGGSHPDLQWEERGREGADGGRGRWSMGRFEPGKHFSCLVISSYQPAQKTGYKQW